MLLPLHGFPGPELSHAIAISVNAGGIVVSTPGVINPLIGGSTQSAVAGPLFSGHL
jgi:hypothetical protein